MFKTKTLFNCIFTVQGVYIHVWGGGGWGVYCRKDWVLRFFFALVLDTHSAFIFLAKPSVAVLSCEGGKEALGLSGSNAYNTKS